MTHHRQSSTTLELLVALLVLLAGLAALALPVTPARAQAEAPLLMEGRNSLYQRVLSRPAAVLRAEPGDRAALVEPFVAPFTIYYVFERRSAGGADWVRVGSSVRGPSQGWMRADEVIDWRQTMVVAFTNPAGRERLLFFRDHDELVDVLNDENVAAIAGELRRGAVDGSLPPDSPVISIEPAEHVDINEQFYVLPILEAERVWLASGYTTRLLEVASVPLNADPLNQGTPSAEDLLRDFRVGIVFVIDTTSSMGPYIDRTREAVRRIYQQIEGSPVADRVSFGLVGFRDNISAVPELEYDTRVFAPLTPSASGRTLLAQLDQIRPATISSLGFDEDALAGVVAAVRMPEWNDYDGRYVVLITDAGPRQASDPLSTTGFGPAQVNALAVDNGIALYTMHLLTPQGEGDHDYASAAYMELSRWRNAGSLYHPVPLGAVNVFGQSVDSLTRQIIGQIQDAMAGRLTEVAPEPPNELEAQTSLVGRAMQLAYLGRERGAQAPDVFRAWTTDRSFEDPRQASLQVRLLITKNELSDLSDVLRVIVEAGQANRLSPEDFFGQLQSAVANLARDPNRLVDPNFDNLGDLMGEYLRDLPYRSLILDLDEQTWLSMGPGRQLEILDNLEALLHLYEAYHDQPDLWIPLYEGAPEGEHVFPISIDALP
ncbi:MAG: VWA domain-containing protein [Rhodospirillaceae bacterium]|nr:VWA domain-containing protein [Rhodospirillaceae bacterium]